MLRLCWTMKRYLVNELEWKKWSSAIGIRHDEQHRCRKESKAGGFLVSVGSYQTNNFRSPDLRLMNVNTPNSNCDLCFLKSEANLAAMAREHPERAQWWIA